MRNWTSTDPVDIQIDSSWLPWDGKKAPQMKENKGQQPIGCHNNKKHF